MCPHIKSEISETFREIRAKHYSTHTEARAIATVRVERLCGRSPEVEQRMLWSRQCRKRQWLLRQWSRPTQQHQRWCRHSELRLAPAWQLSPCLKHVEKNSIVSLGYSSRHRTWQNLKSIINYIRKLNKCNVLKKLQLICSEKLSRNLKNVFRKF